VSVSVCECVSVCVFPCVYVFLFSLLPQILFFYPYDCAVNKYYGNAHPLTPCTHNTHTHTYIYIYIYIYRSESGRRARRSNQGVQDQYGADSSFDGDGSETVSAYSASEMNTNTADEQILERKLAVQDEQIATLKSKIREFAERGQALARALQDSERAMASEQAQTGHLRQQVENLQEEVESRPSVGDWSKQKQSIMELKRQVCMCVCVYVHVCVNM
jgi:hypothetical protein